MKSLSSNIEIEDEKELETSVDDYDYYEGFDEDGNQIIENNRKKERAVP